MCIRDRDRLILANDLADHSALATLRHIIETRKLIASATSVRGEVSVVSLTAVPLQELERLRVFRPHRGRWDFEPYGICIRRSALIAAGARAVGYATDEDWQELPEEDQPFFQLAKSTTRSGNELDWTVEQEWRHIGDVDLDSLDREDVWVFVPTSEEAERLRDVSPWPVITLSDSLP